MIKKTFDLLFRPPEIRSPEPLSPLLSNLDFLTFAAN